MVHNGRMKSKGSDEYTNFSSALRKVLRVSHSEMKAKLDAEKQAKKQQPKQPSAHASGDSD